MSNLRTTLDIKLWLHFALSASFVYRLIHDQGNYMTKQLHGLIHDKGRIKEGAIDAAALGPFLK